MSTLTDAELDAMRAVGDPVVDALVQKHFESRPGAAGSLLGSLFNAPELPKHPLVDEYLAALPPVTLEEPERVVLGQQLFQLFGPEVLLVLGSCALPLAYAAGNGVQVVARAQRLSKEPIRRLCDTAQMVINVMQPGQLEPERVGWVAVRKTRLIHALIRFHTLAAPGEPWPRQYGLPINQEDLAGTLLAFSVAVLQSLRKIGAPFGSEQAEAYLHVWVQVGRTLGLDERLLPENEAEGLELALRIGRRQIRWTKEGQELSDYLLEAVGSVFPIPGYAASLSRFLLEGSAFGNDVAEKLGIPNPLVGRMFVNLRAAEKRLEFALLEVLPGAKARRSTHALKFVQKLLEWKRGGGSQVPFSIPDELRLKWGLA